MKRIIRKIMPITLMCLFLVCPLPAGLSAEDTSGIGPQSTQATGIKKVLIVVVKFPDVTPSVPLQKIKNRVSKGFDDYVREQSYGLASVKADFRGYVMLPEPLKNYKISPYNFKVDKKKIRKLVEDTMTSVEDTTFFWSDQANYPISYENC